MEAVQTANSPGFDTVWAVLQEVAESQKETAKRQEETDRQIKEIGKRFGDFTNRFGEVVERLLSPTLIDRFIDLGLVFQTASTNFKVKDHKNEIYFEIDVFAKRHELSVRYRYVG